MPELDIEEWTLLLTATQTVAVVGAIFVAIGQLRDLARQRSLSSLERMLTEWRRSKALRDELLAEMPRCDGKTLEERCGVLAQLIHDTATSGDANEQERLKRQLSVARFLVYELNDLGAFVERGGVSEFHFFSHFHVRVLEITYLLEPLIILQTACYNYRWGLRLIVMRDAAELFHACSPLEAGIQISAGEQVLAAAPKPRRFARRWWAWRTAHRKYMEQQYKRSGRDWATVLGVQQAIAKKFDLEALGLYLGQYSRGLTDPFK